MKYSIIIPVYNSESTLKEVYNRIKNVFDKLGLDYEVIMVNDGSKDNSWQEMTKIYNGNSSKVKIIQLSRNFGQHNALMCGFRYSQGDYIITIDDDLQNPPEEIPKLIEKINSENFDVGYGIYKEKKHSFLRNIGSKLIMFLYKSIFKVKGNLTGFRIIKKEIIKQIIKYENNFVFIDGLIAFTTKNIGYVEVLHNPRKTGKSGYTISKLLNLSFNLITNFSIFPLQLASFIGKRGTSLCRGISKEIANRCLPKIYRNTPKNENFIPIYIRLCESSVCMGKFPLIKGGKGIYPFPLRFKGAGFNI
jgi:undecaprenyl-phosphate 4-deoxy-4-formamido-L-arabinose transferase